jgi:membrane fusion protein, multidrug efflux system
MSPGTERRRLAMTALGTTAATAALLAVSVYWYRVGRFAETTDNAYVRADVITISSRIAGYVASVAVADNQTIQAGDVLARIDGRDYSAHVRQAEAAVDGARAEILLQQAHIADLAAQEIQQRDVIEQSRADIEAREADAHRASLEHDRQKQLSEHKATSTQFLEAAEADARRAGAALTASRAAAAGARDRLKILASQRAGASAAMEKARASLLQAEATLVLARIDLENTVIRAPANGIVGQRTVRVGQYAEVGTPLLAIVPEYVYVVANYKETQINRIAHGQHVRVRVDAFDGAVLRGQVDSFSPASGAQFALLPPDNATGNFTKIVQRMPIRISFDPGQFLTTRLRPGMSVVTTIETRPAR